MKKGLLTLSIIAIIAFSVSDIYSWGWGHMGSNMGHMGNSYSNMGPGNMQGSSYGNGMNEKNMDAMINDLDLTEKQVEKITSLGSEFRAKYYQNRGNRNKIESLRAEHRMAVENVLEKEQRDRYKRYNSNNGRYGWFGGCYNR